MSDYTYAEGSLINILNQRVAQLETELKQARERGHVVIRLDQVDVDLVRVLQERIEELEAKLEEAIVTRLAVHERIRAEERERCLSVAPPILIEGSNERMIGYSQGVMDYQDAIRKLMEMDDD